MYVSKGALGTALGFSVSGDIGVSITKNSRTLLKGEKIKVDYRLKNNVYTLVQMKEIHMDGQIIDGGTSTVTVKKPSLFADVRFTYISSKGVPYLAEEYKASNNG